MSNFEPSNFKVIIPSYTVPSNFSCLLHLITACVLQYVITGIKFNDFNMVYYMVLKQFNTLGPGH